MRTFQFKYKPTSRSDNTLLTGNGACLQNARSASEFHLDVSNVRNPNFSDKYELLNTCMSHLRLFADEIGIVDYNAFFTETYPGQKFLVISVGSKEPNLALYSLLIAFRHGISEDIRYERLFTCIEKIMKEGYSYMEALCIGNLFGNHGYYGFLEPGLIILSNYKKIKLRKSLITGLNINQAFKSKLKTLSNILRPNDDVNNLTGAQLVEIHQTLSEDTIRVSKYILDIDFEAFNKMTVHDAMTKLGQSYYTYIINCLNFTNTISDYVTLMDNYIIDHYDMETNTYKDFSTVPYKSYGNIVPYYNTFLIRDILRIVTVEQYVKNNLTDEDISSENAKYKHAKKYLKTRGHKIEDVIKRTKETQLTLTL